MISLGLLPVLEKMWGHHMGVSKNFIPVIASLNPIVLGTSQHFPLNLASILQDVDNIMVSPWVLRLAICCKCSE
jgi:hypothetical protein